VDARTEPLYIQRVSTGSAISFVWDRVPVPAEHVAVLLLAALLQRRSPCRRLSAAAAPAGPPLVVAGVLLNAWAVVTRGLGDIERPQRLVTDGPHAWTRNPMYVGWTLIHLGCGLTARSPWMLGSWPASFALVHRAVLREERWLEEEFAEAFTEYRAGVARYAGRRT
jgi:protein-S-isoprenylcysteine O-methyltransferase Ste14